MTRCAYKPAADPSALHVGAGPWSCSLCLLQPASTLDSGCWVCPNHGMLMAHVHVEEGFLHLEAVVVGVCNNGASITQRQDSQGMLQEGICPRAILIAKAEQVLSKERVPANMCLHSE